MVRYLLHFYFWRIETYIEFTIGTYGTYFVNDVFRLFSEQEKEHLIHIFKPVITALRPPRKTEILAYIKQHSKAHLVHEHIKRNGCFHIFSFLFFLPTTIINR